MVAMVAMDDGVYGVMGTRDKGGPQLWRPMSSTACAPVLEFALFKRLPQLISLLRTWFDAVPGPCRQLPVRTSCFSAVTGREAKLKLRLDSEDVRLDEDDEVEGEDEVEVEAKHSGGDAAVVGWSW
ncbi:hypothetical protein E4U58_000957 [Claviceps cyperi]|nr:hypothetical protein E4U58_000957 [Claviceps cyperi]